MGADEVTAATNRLPRRLRQLLRNGVRRNFCFPCDKRTVLEHVHTEAFVRRSRA